MKMDEELKEIKENTVIITILKEENFNIFYKAFKKEIDNFKFLVSYSKEKVPIKNEKTKMYQIMIMKMDITLTFLKKLHNLNIKDIHFATPKDNVFETVWEIFHKLDIHPLSKKCADKIKSEDILKKAESLIKKIDNLKKQNIGYQSSDNIILNNGTKN